MEKNEFEIIQRDFYTFYFIESHLKDLDNNIQVVLDSSNKCFKPLRKILSKDLKDESKQDYIASVYAVDFKPQEIKSKDKTQISGVPSFPIKFALKMKKNKFEASALINLKTDNLKTNLNFGEQKQLFKKDASPPNQMKLSQLDIIQLYHEAIIVKENKQVYDSAYNEYLYLGMNLISKMPKYELILYSMIFISILKGNNIKLIKKIIDIFSPTKIKASPNTNCPPDFQEKMQILFGEQIKVYEKIKKIKNVDHFSYLAKFYTIILYFFSSFENYETCNNLMRELRDNNPFDNLILAKLFISEYSEIYRNIPISKELKNSLMGKFIHSSADHKNLITSFSIISEYLNKDLANILGVIAENYEKIDELCKKENSSVKINDFIAPNPNDDLAKVQYFLEIICQKKLISNFRAIYFDLNLWDYYLSNNNNQIFWNFLKSNLIAGSINYGELIDSFKYIIKYTQKNFEEFLEIIVNNYPKIKFICMNEKLQINIADFVEPNVNDNKEKIKELFSFIITQKVKDQYEVIYFNPNIWRFYIFNRYQFEFLTFIEMNLYENALYSRDILDSIDFSKDLRNKSFISMLEIINFNYGKIHPILKNEGIVIDMQNYVIQQPQTDDLNKIFELIKEIIEKEKANGYLCIKFSEKIWEPYTKCDSIDTLRFIRRIMIECRLMDLSLNEDIIQLPKKIHEVGFMEIQKGTLTGDRLLQFLGIEESFYVNKQLNEGLQREINLQNQVNSQAVEIEKLKILNNNLQERCNLTEKNVVTLENNCQVLAKRVNQLEKDKEILNASIAGLNSKVERLRWSKI